MVHSNFFDQPLLTVVAPVYAKEIYGSPASFGALVGSFGAGVFCRITAVRMRGHVVAASLSAIWSEPF